MSLECVHRQRWGQAACVTACPAEARPDRYQYHRVERAADVPPTDDRAIDVAILDMNHGWPNLGHDALVHAVQDVACDLLAELDRVGLLIRAISYDVRRAGMMPARPTSTCGVFIGTGGPGHLDPRVNDGHAPGSQGIRENPSWEAPLFELFDAVRADERAALLGVCHTFGVMCRWLNVATPELRGADKGGKSAGMQENILTDEARQHPWFSRLANALPDGHRLHVLDSRLYDLIPHASRLPQPLIGVGYEALGIGGPAGPALTMLEVARDQTGTLPRILGVNHHPEIVNRRWQMALLGQRLARGEVTADWYNERAHALTTTLPNEDCDEHLELTSSFTLVDPLRFFIYRQVRRRAEALGEEPAVNEQDVLRSVDTSRSAIGAPEDQAL